MNYSWQILLKFEFERANFPRTFDQPVTPFPHNQTQSFENPPPPSGDYEICEGPLASITPTRVTQEIASKCI